MCQSKAQNMGLSRLRQVISPRLLTNSQVNLFTVSHTLGSTYSERSAVSGTVQSNRTKDMEGKMKHAEDITRFSEEEYQQTVEWLGGKEKFLFVGEVCMPHKKQRRSTSFWVIAQQLFEGYQWTFCQTSHENNSKIKDVKSYQNCGETAHQMLSSTRVYGLETDESRKISYPVLLFIFRHSFVEDGCNWKSVKEIMKDVQLRSKGTALAAVGILYYETKPESKDADPLLLRLSQYLTDIFQGRKNHTSVSVCTYMMCNPESIVAVKKCICDTLRSQRTVMESKSSQKMDSSLFQCFPWSGRRKEKKLSKTKSLEASEERRASESVQMEKTRTRSTPSVSSDGTDGQNNRVYFTGKARVSFRHELDSTASAAESTY